MQDIVLNQSIGTQTQENPICFADLMVRAKNGDNEAFGVLYEEFFTPIYRYIYRRISDQEIAEDLTQTSFLKIFQSLDKFEDQGRSPSSYFYTVARNTMIDFFKKKKYVIVDEEIITNSLSTDTEETKLRTQHHEQQKAVQDALSLLKEDQREALCLKFLDGFKNEEIATIMNKSESAIRQLQCRGIKKLRSVPQLQTFLASF